MRVLISAYACEPGKGSEPGVGWNWIRAAARRHDLCVLTRANNRHPIEAALAAEPLPSVRFVYLDLPSWARFWKRGRRGVRLYYTLWQLLAAHEARRICRNERFDVVHHLTFANVWLPALTCLAGPPFVLGPTAGGQRIPLRLYPALGLRGAVREALLMVRFLSRLNPLVRMAWSRSAVILVNNEETLRSLPARHRARARVRSNACATDVGIRLGPRRSPPVAACVGNLVPLKGVALAIRAIACAPGWQLLVIGKGPDLARLQRIAQRVGVTDRVRFEGALPQAELWRRLAACDALVLPSLKEGASLVAAEAQTVGLPVIALDMNGPAALARTPGAFFELVRPGGVEDVVHCLATALERVREAPRPVSRPDFGLDGIERDVDAVYRASLAARATALREARA